MSTPPAKLPSPPPSAPRPPFAASRTKSSLSLNRFPSRSPARLPRHLRTRRTRPIANPCPSFAPTTASARRRSKWIRRKSPASSKPIMPDEVRVLQRPLRDHRAHRGKCGRFPRLRTAARPYPGGLPAHPVRRGRHRQRRPQGHGRHPENPKVRHVHRGDSGRRHCPDQERQNPLRQRLLP